MPLHLHGATIPSTTARSLITRRGVLISTATLQLLVSASSTVAEESSPESSDTLSNIPQTLSGECSSPKDCKTARIQRPKSRKAELCTKNCLAACTRGGGGDNNDRLPRNNTRGPLIVFKPGFRSRHYCLVECSDICNLLGDQDYGS